jgi:polyisoprenoid-binding protein YceI
MKTKSSLKLTIIALIVGALFAFTPPVTSKFVVDKTASTLVWTGKKITGEHTGNVQLASGELIAEGKIVKQGNFEIDLTSISVTDIKDPEYNAKLVGHLKNEDFFHVDQFPKASFTITSITPKSGEQYDVNGKLTLKGVTKDITFPATIKNDGKKISATAKIKVDRTQFNIRYGSASFFDSLGDKAIDNEFVLDLNLVANAVK